MTPENKLNAYLHAIKLILIIERNFKTGDYCFIQINKSMDSLASIL